MAGDNQNRIGVFIDGSNIWHCQKKNKWRIDFIKLKEHFGQRGRISALYYFTPEIPHMQKFLKRLDKIGYTVVKKPLKKIKLRQKKQTQRFKYKGNLDMEMGLMIVSLADSLDEVILLTGDSDFEVVVETLKNKGKKIVVISNKTGLSKELKKAGHFVIYLHEIKKFVKYKKPR